MHKVCQEEEEEMGVTVRDMTVWKNIKRFWVTDLFLN